MQVNLICTKLFKNVDNNLSNITFLEVSICISDMSEYWHNRHHTVPSSMSSVHRVQCNILFFLPNQWTENILEVL